MFGHMKAQPILTVAMTPYIEPAVSALFAATENAQPWRWGRW